MNRRVSHFQPHAKRAAEAEVPLIADFSKVTFADVVAIFQGSSGEATKSLYEQLVKRGRDGGVIAMNLFRAHKTSTRAKVYTGRANTGERFRDKAYATKQWSIDQLAAALVKNAAYYHIRWGWNIDANMAAIGDPHEHVLYVDIPGVGQVSFHTDRRGVGPEYEHGWDGIRGMGGKRVCELAVRVLDGRFNPESNRIAAETLPEAPAPEPAQQDLFAEERSA